MRASRPTALTIASALLLLAAPARAVRVWEQPRTTTPAPAAAPQPATSTPASPEPTPATSPSTTPATSGTSTPSNAPAQPSTTPTQPPVLGFIPFALASPDLVATATVTPLAAGGHVGQSRYPDGMAERWLDIGFFSQPRFTIQTGYDPSQVANLSVPPGVSLRRTRIVVHGQALPVLQLRLEFDLSDRIDLLDAYALFPIRRYLQLQIGQFRVPFSRQELVSGTRQQFNDPSLWSGAQTGGLPAVPSFDLGLMVWGWAGPRDLFEYYVGVFNGEGRNRLPLDLYPMLAARFAFNPIGRPASFQESAVNLPRSQPTVQIALNGTALWRQLAPTFNGTTMPNMQRAFTAGLDVAFAGYGLFAYAEVYYRTLLETDVQNAPSTESFGVLGQVGYMPPLPYVRDHLEAAFRVQYFAPSACLTRPVNTTATDGANCGVRQPASVDATQYRDFMTTLALTAGINWFASGHGLKVAANYTWNLEYSDIAGMGAGSGIRNNDVFTAQVTGSF